MTRTAGADAALPRLPAIAARGELPCLTRACSACCHDNEMLLTEADRARLGALAPGVDFAFEAGDGFIQLRTRDGPPAPGGTGRPCVFLDAKGLCTVHAARPEGCRLYPAIWAEDLRRAELDADHCPHTDGFLLAPATADAVRRLAARLEAERSDRLRGRQAS